MPRILVSLILSASLSANASSGVTAQALMDTIASGDPAEQNIAMSYAHGAIDAASSVICRDLSREQTTELIIKLARITQQQSIANGSQMSGADFVVATFRSLFPCAGAAR